MVTFKHVMCIAALSATLTSCTNSEVTKPVAAKQAGPSATAQLDTAPSNTDLDTNTDLDVGVAPLTYRDFLYDVSRQRRAFTDNDAAKDSLFQWIDQDMYAYWDDTAWDFYGVSRTPGQGDIACGYFVTTLLKDLGFKIDRVRLAQDVSATMIKELTGDIKITRTVDGMIDYVKTQPSGSVFVVGLDFHTGFVTSGPDGIYFIHSNYIAREGVVREFAATSEALHDSGYFMIGNLSTRADTIEAWRAN